MTLPEEDIDKKRLQEDIKHLTRKATGLLSQMNTQLQRLRDKNQRAVDVAATVRVQLASAGDSAPPTPQQQARAAAATPALPEPPRQLGGPSAARDAAEQRWLADELLAAAAGFQQASHAGALLASLSDDPQESTAAAEPSNATQRPADPAAADGQGGASWDAALTSAGSDSGAPLANGQAAGGLLPSGGPDAADGGEQQGPDGREEEEEVLEVAKQVAVMSPLIQREMVQNGFGLPGNPPIKLPKQVSPAAWDMIMEYCSFHAVPGRSDKERRMFDERFIRRDSSQLCELTSAADGLEMRGLVDLASRAIARLIEGKSAEEIREAFRLPDDLSEEEKLEPIQALGGAPDPRVRMLNRLYAKRRKELLQRRQLLEDMGAMQPLALEGASLTPAPAGGGEKQQQAAQLAQDDRSLDELLSFIESSAGAGSRANGSGGGGKSKKKKAKQQAQEQPAQAEQRQQQQQQQRPAAQHPAQAEQQQQQQKPAAEQPAQAEHQQQQQQQQQQTPQQQMPDGVQNANTIVPEPSVQAASAEQHLQHQTIAATQQAQSGAAAEQQPPPQPQHQEVEQAPEGGAPPHAAPAPLQPAAAALLPSDREDGEAACMEWQAEEPSVAAEGGQAAGGAASAAAAPAAAVAATQQQAQPAARSAAPVLPPRTKRRTAGQPPPEVVAGPAPAAQSQWTAGLAELAQQAQQAAVLTDAELDADLLMSSSWLSSAAGLGSGPLMSALPPSCSRYLHMAGPQPCGAGGGTGSALGLEPTAGAAAADLATAGGGGTGGDQFAVRAALTYRPVTVLTSLANFRGATHVRRLPPQPNPSGKRPPLPPPQPAPAPAAVQASAASVRSGASSSASSGRSSGAASPAHSQPALDAAVAAAAAVAHVLPPEREPGVAIAPDEPAPTAADTPVQAEQQVDPQADAAVACSDAGADVAADVPAVAQLLSSFLEALGLERHLQVVAPDPASPRAASAVPSPPESERAAAAVLPSGARLELRWSPPQQQQGRSTHRLQN